MHASRRFVLPTFLTFAASLIAADAHAAWPSDPNVNVPLCTATADQNFAAIVSDGAGGAIITWTDRRDTLATGSDIYAQRVNAAGEPQWTANGVAVCIASGDQANPTITSDGAGGAIVTWTDGRNGSNDIYAQRVDAAGVPQWTPDGVALCIAVNTQGSPRIISDGAGGAIVTWRDGRTGDTDIYAQRVNAAGVPQWTPDGVALCTAPGLQFLSAIASDGAGGAIVAWEDFRSGAGYDIYAQRVDAAGAPQWTPDGVALCTAIGYQQFPAIASDGAGGAIIAWIDGRLGSASDIFAQRVSAAGATQWAPDGVALCSSPGNQVYPVIISDGSGGAIVTWQDSRGPTGYDVYAQRVDAAGVSQWATNGVALCAASGYQSSPTLAPDGAGGAIVTWEDARDGATHIYARRVNGAGVPQWTDDGVALCTAASGQFGPAIAPDGAGGAIVVWYDLRNGVNFDIYTQRINAGGTLGGVVSVSPSSLTASFGLRGVQPNPSFGDLRVSFSLPDATPATLELYDLAGRRVEALSVGSLGPGAHVTSLTPNARWLLPGVYWVSLAQGSRRAFSKVAIIR